LPPFLRGALAGLGFQFGRRFPHRGVRRAAPAGLRSGEPGTCRPAQTAAQVRRLRDGRPGGAARGRRAQAPFHRPRRPVGPHGLGPALSGYRPIHFFPERPSMRLPTRTLFIASLAAASLLPLAAQAQQQLVPAQSEIQFVSRQMGVPVEGKFRTFSAQVAFDPAKLATSSIVFTVDTGSADISREANAELPKDTWFNVAAFPKATFTSSSIKRIDATKYEVAG